MIFKKIFGRFSKRKQAVRAPLKLRWTKFQEECYDEQLNFIYPVISVIYADDKTERAIILQREDKTYTTAFEKLYPMMITNCNMVFLRCKAIGAQAVAVGAVYLTQRKGLKNQSFQNLLSNTTSMNYGHDIQNGENKSLTVFLFYRF